MSNLCFLVFAMMYSVVGFSADIQPLMEKSAAAADVIAAFESTPDHAIPSSLLNAATCVATVPNLVRGGFGFGLSYGEGLVSCRVPGGWSDPIFFSLSGGSLGLQIGVNSTDLVMVFMRANAVNRLSEGNLTLGGDIAVSAGPLGRDAQADTDYQLKSEIYSYSQSRGLFAGVSLNATVYSLSHADNAIAYGPNVDEKMVLTSGKLNNEIPNPYVLELKEYAK